MLKGQFDGVAIADAGVARAARAHWVKVLPSREHGGAFLIPGAATTRASGWSVSNPIAEAATLRLSDSLYGGRPRLLLTALKAWRVTAHVPDQFVRARAAGAGVLRAARRGLTKSTSALTDFWAGAAAHAVRAVPPGGQSTLSVGPGTAKRGSLRLAEHHLKVGHGGSGGGVAPVAGPCVLVPGEQPLKALPLFRRERHTADARPQPQDDACLPARKRVSSFSAAALLGLDLSDPHQSDRRSRSHVIPSL